MDDVGMLMLRRRTDPKTEDHTLCEPAQSKYMSTFHKQTRMSPECGHIFLCEPAQSKRMSRFHKSHFMRKKSAPQNHGADFVRACAVETHVKISQESLYAELHAEIYRKNAAAQSEHPHQAPAFTLTVRTPQCGHAVWGTKRKKLQGPHKCQTRCTEIPS